MVLAFSDTSEQYCFSEIDLTRINRKICLPPQKYSKNEEPELRANGDFLYVLTQGRVIALDRDFYEVEEFDHKPLQFHSGVLSLSGYKTYHSANRSYENYRVVSHSMGDGLIKLRTAENQE